MNKLSWLIFTALVISLCGAERFLVIFTFPEKSLCILGEGIVKHLLDAGHEVTFITPSPKVKPHPKLNVIDVSTNIEIMNSKSMKILNNEDQNNSPTNMISKLDSLFVNTIESPNVVQLLNDINQKFDAIICHWVLFNDVYTGFGTIFDSPFIWFSPIDPHWMILSSIDESTNPAYVADSSFGMLPPFTFLERVKGFAVQVAIEAFKYFYWNNHSKDLFVKYFGPHLTKRGKAIPSFEDVHNNISLVLGNSHVSVGQAIRLPQNYIPIGGFHIDPDVKPLPEDLQKLLDKAKDGLIYFSMGSNLKSKDLPISLKKGLLNLFGELKQTVLWKFEEFLPDLPKNVHITQWAPQHSILAHPNCILFITHGGLLSTTETVHFGKPIIGIPVFADQFVNIERAVNKGYAIKVPFSYTFVEELKDAIKEIMTNPKYSNKAKELSVVYHDRPASPSKELVHWVEHVVRTKGAYHLRSPAQFVPLYQKYYLDLIALMITVIVVPVFILKRSLKSIKKQNLIKKNK